jgi:hypothetical protein
MDDQNPFSLSSRNRNFIVGLIAAILLVFGPINPPGLIVRIAYLIIIPVLVWFALRFWGSRSYLGSLTNDRITRALFGAVAGALLVGAYLAYTADYHEECDQRVQTRDGSECVGDYVPVKGGDPGSALMLVFLAAFAAWGALAKHSD